MVADREEVKAELGRQDRVVPAGLMKGTSVLSHGPLRVVSRADVAPQDGLAGQLPLLSL